MDEECLEYINIFSKIDIYTKALRKHSKRAIVWRKRSELYLKVKMGICALQDAIKSCRLGEYTVANLTIMTKSSILMGDGEAAIKYSVARANMLSLIPYLFKLIQSISSSGSQFSLSNDENQLDKAITAFDVNLLPEAAKSIAVDIIEATVLYKKQIKRETTNLPIKASKQIFSKQTNEEHQQHLKELLSILCIRSNFRKTYRCNDDRSFAYVKQVIQSTLNANLNVVELGFTAKKGFCLFAKKKFKIGDVIMCETPLVSFYDDFDKSRCSHCHRPIIRKVECSKCGEVYCCLECMTNAKTQYHGRLCGTTYKNLENKILEIGISSSSRLCCLVIRLMGMLSSMNNYNTPLDIPGIRVLSGNCDISHPPLIASDYMTEPLQCNQVQYLIDELSSPFASLFESHPEFGVEALAVLCQRLTLNSFTTEQGLTAILTCLSFINHDCTPNTEVMSSSQFSGNLSFLIAKQEMNPGDELTKSYVSGDYKKRQTSLLYQYGFKCTCSRCEVESLNSK